MRRILILGGSYFLGRIFVEQAVGHDDLTVLNRGTYRLQYPQVKQYVLDRHDIRKIRELPPEEYDTVIDFCGYKQGDIQDFTDNFKGKIRQYIFVSTVDVYERQTGKMKNEASSYEYRSIAGEAGEYISGKIALEKELKSCAEVHRMPYTIVRPAILYGRYNYAPRENYYARCIAERKPVYYPVDADGVFQFIYVDDAAKMILSLCGNEKAYNESFNLCSGEMVNYHRFFEILKDVTEDESVIREIAVSEIRNEFFPFPLTLNESELYDGKKICEISGLEYTDFESSMEKTIRYFVDIFRQ